MSLQRFLSLFWPPIVVLSLHILRVAFLPTHTELDMLAHFCGGASIALVAWKIEHELIRHQQMQRPPLWLSWFLCIATAELMGAIWEMWEFYLQSHFQALGLTLADTMSDLTLDLFGAIVLMTTVVIYTRSRPRE